VPLDEQGEVTRLLQVCRCAGTEETRLEAKRALLAEVYKDLHNMARARMQGERPNHTWGATELVHEVCCRLMQGQKVFKKDRKYFFGAVRRAMNQLLREHARRRKCRPEGHIDPEGHILLDEIVKEVESTLKVDLLDLSNALDKLKATGARGPRRYDVVKLRIWEGLSYEKIAKKLGVGVTTVEKDWLAARAWLYGQLKRGRTDD
jgi:RNA polymerase sigma factor (TIGR02999 family)